MRSWLIRLATVVVSAAGALVVGEVVLRRVTPIPPGQPPLYEHDPVLGWRHKPGVSADYKRPDGRVIRVVINDKGYRGRALPQTKSRGIRRILVLGDSLTEALAVDWPDAYASQLEQHLQASGGPYEVLALGTSSYGTVHEYLVLRNEGLAYAPDLTILQVCVNDFWDNVQQLSYQRRGPWASVPTPAGPVQITPPSTVREPSLPDPVPPWRRAASDLKWRSAIAYRLALLTDRAFFRGRTDRRFPKSESGTRTDPRRDPRFAVAKCVLCLLLREMRDVCLNHGSQFAVYINPSTQRLRNADQIPQTYYREQ